MFSREYQLVFNDYNRLAQAKVDSTTIHLWNMTWVRNRISQDKLFIWENSLFYMIVFFVIDVMHCIKRIHYGILILMVMQSKRNIYRYISIDTWNEVIKFFWVHLAIKYLPGIAAVSKVLQLSDESFGDF